MMKAHKTNLISFKYDGNTDRANSQATYMLTLRCIDARILIASLIWHQHDKIKRTGCTERTKVITHTC